MIDIVKMTAVLFAGLLLGGFFFGGLLWTIERGLSAKHPAFWFLGSWLVRTAVIMTSFYLISAGRWERMLLCAAGFFIARFIVIRFNRTAEEAGNAS
jgi:F1F0 ATPase subunit 2